MNSSKEKLLNQVYDEYINLMLYDFPIEKINEIVASDVKGFGSTRDEKFVELNRLRQMVIDQREQAAGIKIEWKRTPINKRISPKEDIAIYTDEFLLSMKMETGEHIIPLRLSSVFEFFNDTWKLVHIHGSMGVETENDDTWHINEWQKKNEELQRLVNEKTADLKQKNRELEIEAALERVRAKAIAMQDSKDISDATAIIFNELGRLGIKMERSGIATHIEKTTFNIWSTPLSSDNRQVINIINGKLDFAFHPMIKGSMESWKKQNPFYSYDMVGNEEIQKYYHLLEQQSGYRFPLVNTYPKRQILNSFNFREGMLFAYTEIPISEEELDIFLRFTKVFSLTFRRYQDLIKAENQIREAMKQASLDRVRGEIASMRNSEDLNRITPLIWRELKALEVPFFRCGVFIINEEEQKVGVYLSTPEGKAIAALNLFFNANELTKNTVEHWKKRQIFKTHWNKKEFVNWIRSMMELGQVTDAKIYQGTSTAPKSLYLHFVPFKQGMLYVGDKNPLLPEKIELIKTLAEAFSIAYARYEDFKNLEEAKLKTENTLKELKAAQAQLIQSEKMASLGELTAGIAHEIQNPLNFVNNFSELSVDLIQEMGEELESGNMEEVTTISEDLKQNLQKINFHGKRASSIVKGMLEHSRASGHEKQKTDINKLVDEYLRLSFHGLRAKDKSFNSAFEFNPDESLPEIMIISQDVGRVFLNIINNAFYAVSTKSKLLNGEFHPMVEVSTTQNRNNIEIHIKDNGDGIPASAIDKIFQPFFTTKPTGQGTGLGLSLSYDIITKSHNGKLEVETKEGLGTEFIITLPI